MHCTVGELPQRFRACPSQKDLGDVLLTREIHNGLRHVFSGEDVRFDVQISRKAEMLFQGLAVIPAKKKWPDLIACERKKTWVQMRIADPTTATAGC